MTARKTTTKRNAEGDTMTTTTPTPASAPTSLADILNDENLPQWTDPGRRLDLAAAVQRGDEEALDQHRQAWAQHLRRRRFIRHAQQLRQQAEEARASARRALDGPDLEPGDVEELLDRAAELDGRARRFSEYVSAEPPAPLPRPVDWRAKDQAGSAARDRLHDGMKNRLWWRATLAAREAAAVELGRITGQTHPLPAGVTEADLTREARPVASVKAKIESLDQEIDEVTRHGRDARYGTPLKVLRHRRDQLAASLTPAPQPEG